MSERRTAWRRLAAALAGAALLVLGAPLHQHCGAASAAAPTVAEQASLVGTAHTGAGCPACQTSARSRAGLAPAGLVELALVLPALRLDVPGAPAASSAASRPPTPPRGPPSPTA